MHAFRFSWLISGLMALSLHAGEILTVRHMWTLSPVEDVLCICMKDTVFSDAQGKIVLPAGIMRGDSLILEKNGYFRRTLSVPNRSDEIIYLIPIESTDIIMAVFPVEPDSRIMLPAHISRIPVREYDALSAFSVGDLLRREAGVLVKSYGSQGQLETISLRGMGAEQTQVLLDGVPVNSMQNGSVDLGLYPLMHLANIDVYRGAHYLFGGSGSVGGTINLIPQAPAGQFGFSGSAGYASFDNRQLIASADLPVGDYRQRIYVESVNADNDYTTESRGEQVALRNRDVARRALSYHSEYRFAKDHIIGLFASNTRQENGAPKPFVGALPEQDNRARMTSDLNLVNLKFSGTFPPGKLKLQLYNRNEWMTYSDPAILIGDDVMHSIHFNREQGGQLRWRKLWSERLLLMAGTEFAWFSVRSSDAGAHHRRRRAAYLLGDWVIGSRTRLFDAIHLNAGSRLEDYSDFGAVFLPSVGLSGVWENGQVYATAGKNYRSPTFNDLYWIPGGNPNLKPEQSLNMELGMNYIVPLGPFEAEVTVTGFVIHVDRQIKWTQAGEYWMPQNILNVISKGTETGFGIRDKQNRFQIHSGFSYGLSLKNRAEFEGDRTAGNRLPYTPSFQWNASASGSWRSISSGIHFQGMDSRYTTLENRNIDRLPAHMVWGAWVQNRMTVRSMEIRFGVSADNVFDVRYEVIKGYPLPGRTCRVTFSAGYR